MAQPTQISIGLLLLLPVIYWALIIAWRGSKARAISPDSLPDPSTLSPVSIRLFWIGQADWDLLVINFLEVVRKGMYQAVWKDVGHGFVINLIKPQLFAQLEPEEREGISFGGQPLRQINAQIKKTSMTEKLLDKVEASLLKRYREYFLPWNHLLRGGMAISGMAFLLSISLIHQYDVNEVGWLILGTVLLIAFAVELVSRWMEDLFSFNHSDFSLEKVLTSIFIAPTKLVLNEIGIPIFDPTKDTIFTTDSFATLLKRITVLFFMLAICLIAIRLEGWIFLAFFISMIAQLFVTSYSSSLSPKGIVMRQKLEKYRANLATQTYKYPENTPLWLALDLECPESRVVRPLLTGSSRGLANKNKSSGIDAFFDPS